MEIGFGKIILLMLVALLVFGAKRIPEIGQGLGKGIREFKKSLTRYPGRAERPDARRPRAGTAADHGSGEAAGADRRRAEAVVAVDARAT